MCVYVYVYITMSILYIHRDIHYTLRCVYIHIYRYRYIDMNCLHPGASSEGLAGSTGPWILPGRRPARRGLRGRGELSLLLSLLIVFLVSVVVVVVVGLLLLLLLLF